MEPQDLWDTVHLRAVERVEAFADAIARNPAVAPSDARRHIDNAYVLAEYLANTFPKIPRDATERDIWLFLFDYYMTQGPFGGVSAELLPTSVRLFFEFLARGERVREIEHIRAACEMDDYFRRRLLRLEEIAKGASADERTAAAALEDWYRDLDQRMRERGLVPDASLAGGEEVWGREMGPLEAAVFDGLCLLLAQRAREAARRRVSRDELERDLLNAQRTFMTTRNPQLRATPLEAVMRERAEAQSRGFAGG